MRASYWFLPLVLLVASQVLVFAAGWLDRAYPNAGPVFLPAVFHDTQAEGARALLSLMASSVIGVTGVMFSLTMVAVSFASGNFGPRLVTNFMRDRGNQWSLGLLIATFAFCLQALRIVKGPDEPVFVPHLVLAIAMLLTFVSVVVMIYFIHHVPETINVSNITAGLSRRLEAAIAREVRATPGPQPAEEPIGECLVRLCLGQSGYIRTLDADRVEALREQHGWHVRLRAQPGDFVSRNDAVLDIHAGSADTPPDSRACDALRACFAVGDSRTEDQNPLFLADQLVEIAVRALSPGINDPFTARDCLNRMYAALDLALTFDGGLDSRSVGPMGRKRLTVDSLLACTFGAALPYAAQDPMARAHMDDLLHMLSLKARSDQERGAIEEMQESLQAMVA